MAWEPNATRSKQFYMVCKKCEETDEEEIIDKLSRVIQKCGNGFEDIDINYTPPHAHYFALKFIFKFNKPQTLKYIMDNFMQHPHQTINFGMLDNPNLNNNVLHYLIADITRGAKDIDNALEMLNLLFYSTADYREQLLSCYDLLYAKNAYNCTPSEYAASRSFKEIGEILENLQLRHIHELMCAQCNIPEPVAVIIIQYAFQIYYVQDILTQFSATHSALDSSKSSRRRPEIHKKWKIGEKCFPYDEIQAHFGDMTSLGAKEMYLSDAEFEQIFAMSKSRFRGLQQWKRKSLKKRHGLL